MNDDKSKPHLVNREKQHAVVVREKVPMNQLPQFFGRVFGKTMGVAQAQGRQIIGPPFAVYFGMPTDTVDVAAGFPIDAPVEAADGTEPYELPGGQAVELLHVGTYESLSARYPELTDWMTEQKLTPAGIMWESYLNDPGDNPEAAQTLVTWPVS